MIKVLDNFTSDKIVKGDSIERPTSIIKELVENSIDAGATTIYIEVKNGGKSYIRVTDNGCGIPVHEIEAALLRHSTSKISKIEDLNDINTLGFRGEALSNIADISNLTIVSRTADSNVGTKLCSKFGQPVSKEPVKSNIGTTIIVEDVFYDSYRRKKFSETAARESRALAALVENFALYYSGIKFALVNNGEMVLLTSGDSNYTNTISAIFPANDFKDLIEISYNNVKGYISYPETTKASNRWQLFYVNGRNVRSNAIEKGILKGYGDKITNGYPIAFIFIDASPSTFDVNISPTKTEITFADEDKIINDVSIAIATSLANPKSEINKPKEAVRFEETTTVKKNIDEELDIDFENKIPVVENIHSETISDVFMSLAESKKNDDLDLNSMTFKGEIFDSYILMQSNDSIYFFDQKACYEKIGEKISTLDINDLMLKLSECDEPYSSPDGKPIFIKISKDDIEKSFNEL